MIQIILEWIAVYFFLGIVYETIQNVQTTIRDRKLPYFNIDDIWITVLEWPWHFLKVFTGGLVMVLTVLLTSIHRKVWKKKLDDVHKEIQQEQEELERKRQKSKDHNEWQSE